MCRSSALDASHVPRVFVAVMASKSGTGSSWEGLRGPKMPVYSELPVHSLYLSLQEGRRC